MSEKFAIVTGTSSGLGKAMAELLLEKEYIVFGGSRSGTTIDNDDFFDINLDVTSEESVEEFYSIVKDTTKTVDLLVNNAGICHMSPLEKTEMSEFESQLKTNLIGPFLMLKNYSEFIKDGESHVINVLSTAAKHAYPNVAAYNASKFGFLGMIEALKKEWSSRARMTNLFPGAIDTPLWDEIGRNFPKNKMLTVEEFIYVFESVIGASKFMQFPDITFLHKDGFLE